jgi:hypothetical protein
MEVRLHSTITSLLRATRSYLSHLTSDGWHLATRALANGAARTRDYDDLVFDSLHEVLPSLPP